MLVTRPEPEAYETAARLAALGIEAVVEPLLRFSCHAGVLPNPAGFAALAVTSGNALRALDERGDLPRLRQIPLYAVGDRTAEIARRQGFSRVASAGGDFAGLVALVAGAGLRGPVLYPAGERHGADLAKALAPAGLMVITTPVYTMTPASRFSPEVAEALAANAFAAALFYSRHTAEIFAAKAKTTRRLGVLCLSESVAEPLLAAHFRRVSLADHPSEEAMMALALSFARGQNPA